jgi:hypothetical protein
MKVYRESIDEFDSYESFIGHIYTIENLIVFPYINLAVSHHPLNKSEQLMYIDRSYLVFGGVERFAESDTELFSKTTQAKYDLCHGGISIIDLCFKEFIIECNNWALFVFNDSKVRTEPWVPIDTETQTKNMAEQDIAFMSLKPDIEKMQKELTSESAQ